MTTTTEFAQEQIDIIEARVTALGLVRLEYLDRVAYWEGIGGYQGTLYAGRATRGIANIDAELLELARQKVKYATALATGIFSLGHMNSAGEWIP